MGVNLKDLVVSKQLELQSLQGKVLALAFFEPSTRTMFSFQTSMLRLGGSVLVFSEVEKTSIAKGENLGDTIRMLDSYANAIVIRHRIEGAASYAAEIAESPVINAGDGTHHHPTQAMIDYYTIWKEKGGIEGCLLYTSPSPRDLSTSRMPSSA